MAAPHVVPANLLMRPTLVFSFYGDLCRCVLNVNVRSRVIPRYTGVFSFLIFSPQKYTDIFLLVSLLFRRNVVVMVLDEFGLSFHF